MTEDEFFDGIRDRLSPREFSGFIRRKFHKMLGARDLFINYARVAKPGNHLKSEAMAYRFEYKPWADEKMSVLGCWQRNLPISVTMTFSDGKELIFHEYATGNERPGAIVDATLTKLLYKMIMDKSERQK